MNRSTVRGHDLAIVKSRGFQSVCFDSGAAGVTCPRIKKEAARHVGAWLDWQHRLEDFFLYNVLLSINILFFLEIVPADRKI